MKKVILLCSLGMSANVFVMALKEECESLHLTIECEAQPISEALSKAMDADLILLSPQVRYNYDKIVSLFPTKKVKLIEAKEFSELDVTLSIDEIRQIISHT